MSNKVMLGHCDVATRLPVQDLERARFFYAEKLGLEPVEERPGGLLYRCRSGSFALFISSGASSGDYTQMAWEVTDLRATVKALRVRGFSPYLAYRFSMGQIYEGVSSAMSQFAAMIIGTGVEAYSTTAAAGINQTAQNTQAQGSDDAQTTEAKANRESGMLRNQAGFIAGKASALSAAQATAGAALAAGRAGVNQAYAMFGSAARGIEGYNERLSNSGRERNLADNTAVSKRQANEANTDSQVARKEEWSKGLNQVPIVGGPADLVRKWDSGVASYLNNRVSECQR